MIPDHAGATLASGVVLGMVWKIGPKCLWLSPLPWVQDCVPSPPLHWLSPRIWARGRPADSCLAFGSGRERVEKIPPPDPEWLSKATWVGGRGPLPETFWLSWIAWAGERGQTRRDPYDSCGECGRVWKRVPPPLLKWLSNAPWVGEMGPDTPTPVWLFVALLGVSGRSPCRGFTGCRMADGQEERWADTPRP